MTRKRPREFKEPAVILVDGLFVSLFNKLRVNRYLPAGAYERFNL